MKKYTNFFFYWLPVLAYCVLIFVQSSLPAPSALPSIPYMDKVLHTAGYAVLGALFFRAFRKTRPKESVSRLIFLSIVCSGLYGCSDELHQYFVSYRSAEITDILADWIGSGIGAAGYHRAVKYWEKIIITKRDK